MPERTATELIESVRHCCAAAERRIQSFRHDLYENAAIRALLDAHDALLRRAEEAEQQRERREWLKKKAAEEDGCIVSAGGLVSDIEQRERIRREVAMECAAVASEIADNYASVAGGFAHHYAAGAAAVTIAIRKHFGLDQPAQQEGSDA